MQALRSPAAKNTSTNSDNNPDRIPASVRAGAVALVFLIVGYEISLFVHHAAIVSIADRRDHPDTVWITMPAETGLPPAVTDSSSSARLRAAPSPADRQHVVPAQERRNSEHNAAVEAVRKATRKVESFRFDPNTVSVADLQRLGFSEKQALSIDHYRAAGGHFNRPEDFGRSYVVADTVFERLRPYIDIPLLDINKADTAAFDALPGIGGYYARKMVELREQLGGYSTTGQLLDIWNFGEERYNAIRDLIVCHPGDAPSLDLWTLPEDSLAHHPLIRSRSTAHGIAIFRSNTSAAELAADGGRGALDAMLAAGVLTPAQHASLSRCRISPPPGY